MPVELKTRRFLTCPNCNRHDFEIEHLLKEGREGKFGPWWCSMCNEALRFEIQGGDVVDAYTEQWYAEPRLCLMRFRDVYLVVDSYSQPRDKADPLWYDYLFHSHQCPTNMLNNAIEMYDPAEGRDPHGVVRFVAAIPDTDENHERLDECWTLQHLFLLFQTDGQDAPTRWPESERGLIPGLARLQDVHRKAKAPKA